MDLLLAIFVLMGVAAPAWYFGYLHGWNRRGRCDASRREVYDWMHKYSIGEATMADAPWRKEGRNGR